MLQEQSGNAINHNSRNQAAWAMLHKADDIIGLMQYKLYC